MFKVTLYFRDSAAHGRNREFLSNRPPAWHLLGHRVDTVTVWVDSVSVTYPMDVIFSVHTEPVTT